MDRDLSAALIAWARAAGAELGVSDEGRLFASDLPYGIEDHLRRHRAEVIAALRIGATDAPGEAPVDPRGECGAYVATETAFLGICRRAPLAGDEHCVEHAARRDAIEAIAMAAGRTP